jgi:hypothetical protein
MMLVYYNIFNKMLDILDFDKKVHLFAKFVNTFSSLNHNSVSVSENDYELCCSMIKAYCPDEVWFLSCVSNKLLCHSKIPLKKGNSRKIYYLKYDSNL